MAEIKIADLIAELHASTSRFNSDINKLKRKVDEDTKKMEDSFRDKVGKAGARAFKRLRDVGVRAMNRLGRVARRAIIGGVVAAIGAMSLAIIKSVRVSARFESMQLRLEQLVGSAKEAREQFEKLVIFSARTPFQLEDLVEGAATLEAFGAESKSLIPVIADLAAFMGIRLPEAAGAFGRAFAAGAGAADILRERGVLNLVRLGAGVNDLTKLTLPQFRKALIEAMVDPSGRIAGGTAKLAATAEGRWSTAKDKITLAFKAIGDAILVRILPQFEKWISRMDNWTSSDSFEKFTSGMVVVTTKIAEATEIAAKVAKNFISSFSEVDDITEKMETLNRELTILEDADPLTFFGKDLFGNVARIERRIKEVKKELSGLGDELLKLVKIGVSDIPDLGGGGQPEAGEEDVLDIDRLANMNVLTDEQTGKVKELNIELLKQKHIRELIEDGMEKLAADEDEAAEKARELENELKGVANQLGIALRSGEDFLKVLVRIALQKLALSFTGPVGIGLSFLSGIFGGGGGGRVGQSGHIQAAFGLSGRVPQGFNRDDFLIGVTSGEDVDIKTPAQSAAGNRAQRELSNSIQALSVNVSKIRDDQLDIFAMVSIEDREFQLTVEKAQRRDLRFR